MQEATPRVLVVDDDPVMRASLRRTLLNIGFEPLLAETGEQALSILETGRIDVLLLDLRLPGRDGHAVVRELRRRGDSLPIVAMSGKGGMNDLVRLLRRGATDFLSKPFTEEQLEGAMERALATKEGTRMTGSARASRPRIAPTKTTPPDRLTTLAPKELSATTASAHVRDVVRQVRDGAIAVPALGERTEQLMRLAGTPSCSVEEALKWIGGAPRLSQAVLTAAAATTFTPGVRVTNLREAARLRGPRRLISLAIEEAIRDAFQLPAFNDGTWVSGVWNNARLTARIADALVDLLPKAREGAARGVSNLDDMYLAALLHNCGELVLHHLVARQPHLVLSDPMALQALGREIATQHEILAPSIAASWKMPPLAARLSAYHHHPMTKPEPEHHRVQRHVVLSAWALAIGSGASYLPNQKKPDPMAYLADIGIEPDAVGYLIELAPRWLVG